MSFGHKCPLRREVHLAEWSGIAKAAFPNFAPDGHMSTHSTQFSDQRSPNNEHTCCCFENEKMPRRM
jgi:hypothetical protein